MDPAPENCSQEQQENPQSPCFTVQELIKPKRRLSWKIMAPLAVAMIAVALTGYHLHWDAKIVGAGILLVGLLSNVFAWVLALVGVVPVVGPLIVQLVGLPIIWLLNSLGSLISVVAVRRGYSRDVLTYRGLTFALITGIVIGFVLGKLI